MLGRGEVRWTDIAMPDFLRSPHLRKIIVYCNKIHLCQTQLNWNIIIWILLFQICLKGSNIFKGYVNDPKETAETIDEDDWLHIGYIGLFISGLFLLKLSKQHWQKEHIISVSESNSYKLKGFFFLLSIKWCFFVVVLFYKIENHLLKVSHLNLRIQKANSYIHSMPMFIFVIFDISTSCVMFLLFFWLTLTSMIHAINVPFLSNLTFPSMSILLLPLFTSVCCKYITHCFDFYLFGCMFVSCT